MEFGFGLHVQAPLDTPENIRAVAVRGEELGFDYLAFPDHIVMPKDYASVHPYSDRGRLPRGDEGDFLEQLTAMTYVAAVTSRMRVMTSVLVVPHRPAVMTAKMLATMDVLSEGRVSVACGAGWLEEEFQALGAPSYAERGRVTDEYIQAFKELWTSDHPSMSGKFVNISDIIFEPKPVQKPHPPIFIGGESVPALRRVVELGDGWFPIGRNPRNRMDTRAKYQANVERLHAVAEENGRAPASITLGFWAQWHGLGEDLKAEDGTRHLFSGSAEDIASDVEFFRDMGGSLLMFRFIGPTVEETMERMERHADELLPLVRDM